MEEAVWGIAGIVVGVGATIGVEWWVDRRHRSRDFRAARMRTRDYMTEGIRGCGLYATLGAWSGPPARPDPVDLGLIREHADQDQWRRIDHGVGAVVAATMTANSPLILDDHELRSGVIEGFAEDIAIGVHALDSLGT